MKRVKFIFVFLSAVLFIIPWNSGVLAAGINKKKAAATKQEAPKSTKDTVSKYDKLLKNAVSAQGGFITLHKVGCKKIYMEYPMKYLGRRILIGGTVSAVSNPAYVNVGYKHTSPIHLQVDMRDTLLLLNKPNTAATLNSSDEGLKCAFAQNFIPKLYKPCPILAYNRDSTAVLVEITSLIQDMGPHNGTLTPSKEKDKEKEKSTFGAVKSFEDNASVELYQDVSVDLTIRPLLKLRVGDVTTVSNVSILLLPDEPMKPRIQDSRVGVFQTKDENSYGLTPKYELSESNDGARPYFLANRWRIEPTDIEAWKQGEKVTVRKPIVWYVDNAFPVEWREPIRKGVLMWNQAFEKIGLKDVLQVRDFPTREEDPEFDPNNLKYSCLRYSPAMTMNAMGPSWVDPVTGEILNASVIVFNDIIRLINNWRFVQTAQVDERVRVRKMPREIVEESLVYVISHEIGHTLGLMHNMAASAAFPVDSLRSATFTQQYGTTSSIMDYARYNYVAQPGDKGVKLTPPNLGVYDEYVIKWLYSPVPEAKDMWEEAEIAGKLIDEKAGNPYYRYGRQQMLGNSYYASYDPSAMAEDLGDDPIKAGDYGIANLKYILPNIDKWIAEDKDFAHSQGLYVQIANQYYGYLMNVLYQIGGIYLYDVKDGTPGRPAVPVDKKRQKGSLVWLMNQMRNCSWINCPELTDQFVLHTDISATICSMIAAHLTSTVPDHVTLSAHIARENPYTIREYYNDLYSEVFRTTLQGGRLTAEEKTLQRNIVAACTQPMITAKNAQKFSSEMPLQTDYSNFPAYEELVFQRAIAPEITARFGEYLAEAEARYGKGFIAYSLWQSDYFGETRAPYQRNLGLETISEVEPYSQMMISKIHMLMNSKKQSAPVEDRAHYEYLWRMTGYAVGND